MNYQETLDWLFKQLPMYQRIGKAAYKSDLDTTIKLLKAIGNPQNSFKAIHIAGTNGKGSVSHVLASILQQAGYKTALYTSPHLKDFRERIKINGDMIPKQDVVEFVDKYQTVFNSLEPSFFEMTVGLAYYHFARQEVDIAILETGMGGRLDSTNVCQPLASVITNIGHDHMQFLGNSLEAIATEKAGIIKMGIPVVVGKKQNKVDAVFEKTASEKYTKVTYADAHFLMKKLHQPELLYQEYDVWHKDELYLSQLRSPLLGNYQDENLATAFQTLEVLKTAGLLRYKKEDLSLGVKHTVEQTGLMGRWQILSTHPLTICDTGHNPEGIRQIVQQLFSLKYENLHMVFGMVNDKNPETILYLLPKKAHYYFCKPNIPRGMEAEILEQHAFKAGMRGHAYSSVTAALRMAQNNAGLNDLIFIGGSTFVVAEVV